MPISHPYYPFLVHQPDSKASLTLNIPADVKAEKIAKGLCYYCDQKYDRDHKCNFRGTQIFTVEVNGSVQEDGTSNEGVDLETSEEMEPFIVEPKISMNALTGDQDFQTMRVLGMINNTRIHILIDSSSTHNFLVYSFAKRLGCKLEKINPQAITVADGNCITCDFKCSKVE